MHGLQTVREETVITCPESVGGSGLPEVVDELRGGGGEQGREERRGCETEGGGGRNTCTYSITVYVVHNVIIPYNYMYRYCTLNYFPYPISLSCLH